MMSRYEVATTISWNCPIRAESLVKKRFVRRWLTILIPVSRTCFPLSDQYSLKVHAGAHLSLGNYLHRYLTQLTFISTTTHHLGKPRMPWMRSIVGKTSQKYWIAMKVVSLLPILFLVQCHGDTIQVPLDSDNCPVLKCCEEDWCGEGTSFARDV